MKAKNDTAIVSVCSKPFLKDKRKKKILQTFSTLQRKFPKRVSVLLKTKVNYLAKQLEDNDYCLLFLSDPKTKEPFAYW